MSISNATNYTDMTLPSPPIIAYRPVWITILLTKISYPSQYVLLIQRCSLLSVMNMPPTSNRTWSTFVWKLHILEHFLPLSKNIFNQQLENNKSDKFVKKKPTCIHSTRLLDCFWDVWACSRERSNELASGFRESWRCWNL